MSDKRAEEVIHDVKLRARPGKSSCQSTCKNLRWHDSHIYNLIYIQNIIVSPNSTLQVLCVCSDERSFSTGISKQNKMRVYIQTVYYYHARFKNIKFNERNSYKIVRYLIIIIFNSLVFRFLVFFVFRYFRY